MIRKFHFKGFYPSLIVRSRANQILNRLLDRSPYGAAAVAILEKEEQSFRCHVDIYTSRGPLITSAIGKTALGALESVEEKVASKMDRWAKLKMNPTAEEVCGVA